MDQSRDRLHYVLLVGGRNGDWGIGQGIVACIMFYWWVKWGLGHWTGDSCLHYVLLVGEMGIGALDRG